MKAQEAMGIPAAGSKGHSQAANDGGIRESHPTGSASSFARVLSRVRRSSAASNRVSPANMASVPTGGHAPSAALETASLRVSPVQQVPERRLSDDGAASQPTSDVAVSPLPSQHSDQRTTANLGSQIPQEALRTTERCSITEPTPAERGTQNLSVGPSRQSENELQHRPPDPTLDSRSQRVSHVSVEIPSAPQPGEAPVKPFTFTTEQLYSLVRSYITRTKYEELELLESYGGVGALETGLLTSFQHGLDVTEEALAPMSPRAESKPASPRAALPPLSPAQELLQKRKGTFGVNVLPQRKPTPFWRLCLDAASDFTLRILTLCGLISIVLGVTVGEQPEVEWIEGFAIWVAVLVVIAVTATNDWVKEKQFRKLGRVKDDKLCRVVRAGRERQTPVNTLLVGDVVRLEVGDEIPADCLLISGTELRADESALTGESEAIAKAPPRECQEALRARRALPPPLGSTPQPSDVQTDEAAAAQTPAEETAADSRLAADGAEAPENPHSGEVNSRRASGAAAGAAPQTGAETETQARASSASSSTVECSSAEKRRTSFLGRDTKRSLSALLESVKKTNDAPPAPTGEHHETPSPILLAGTAVVGGSGRALVVGVGIHSQQGEMYRQLTSFDAQPTPLQNKLNALARDIGRIGFVAACLTLLVLFVQYWILYALLPEESRPSAGAIGREHVDFLVTAITIIVVAVPEGLPLAVTISLAYSIGKMLKDQNYVRRLAACETMGGANEICSDKTGTLTKNLMSVEALWAGADVAYRDDELWARWRDQGFALSQHATGAPSARGRAAATGRRAESSRAAPPASSDDQALETEKTREDKRGRSVAFRGAHTQPGLAPTRMPSKYFKIFMDNIALNSTSVLERKALPVADSPARSRLISLASGTLKATQTVVKQVGSPTECALLEFAGEMGFDYERLRDEKLLIETDLVHREPFTSDRKLMTTVVNVWDEAELPSADAQPSPQLSGASSAASELRSGSILRRRLSGPSRIQAAALASPAGGLSPPPRPSGSLPALSTYRVLVKGAAETVLRLCAHVVCPLSVSADAPESEREESAAALAPLDAERILEIERTVIHRLAGEALRTICLAYRDITVEDGDRSWLQDSEIKPFKKMEVGLTCLAIVGIRDPVRAEVPAAVRACQKAGIRVRMVTGDNIETAKQIAIKCNIYHPESNGLAMTASEFNALVGGVVCNNCRLSSCSCPRDPTEEKRTGKKMRTDVIANPDAFNEIADNLEVLSRSQPHDKYVLVVGLKQRGAVVAVTGDGANDAPALKTADVGFAMGISGKEVAKQAADIVLLDDNFGSIVKAVKWGRNVYDNIRRFLQFQLTVNVVAVTTAFLTAMVIRESPLTAVQMLWVNLIMDSFASLALATEPPTDELLNRKPHSRKEYLVSQVMFRNIVGQAIYQLTVLLLLIFGAERFIPEEPWTYLSHGLRTRFPKFCEFSDCTQVPDALPRGTFIRSGRRYLPFSNREDYFNRWRVDLGASRHYTLVFNVFVFMQIFNMLNARKINDEWNVSSGVLRNKLWISIALFIGVVQVLVVEFGGIAVSCHFQGLTGAQWVISLAFGAGSVLVGFLLHLVPYKFLPQTGKKEVDLLHAGPSLALASRGRLSSERLSVRLGGGVGLTSEQKRALLERVGGYKSESFGGADPPLHAVNSAVQRSASRRKPLLRQAVTAV
ncbi:calcium-translocating P-type ATPase, PMCA-type protein [Besnoitia besnoiti]|uniref:Calcium-translocating P-type ATPase, PMCA-type protein n=1 Tax=Besnoitia besnoiti TaxID=94643 RepID=A0A2A9MQR4_BESBE|nr:calcium-translocating P-type ATPase, PMCA-type protein [Besnoitia besnoiti]PFH38470.1 calcium-translocating P-type ATPase, PMCA-type protein [Besnoitia besnoiti]